MKAIGSLTLALVSSLAFADQTPKGNWTVTFPSARTPGLMITSTLTFAGDGSSFTEVVDCGYSQIGFPNDVFASYQYPIFVDSQNVTVLKSFENETIDNQTGKKCSSSFTASAFPYQLSGDSLQIFGETYTRQQDN